MKQVFFLSIILFASGCFRASPQKPEKKSCKGEFSWPNHQKLFTRFANDRNYMHRFLHNGDELWPKQANLCALGRNSLVDLALGAGTSHDLGLKGSAWRAHYLTIAWTNDFKRLSDPLKGSRLIYSWPLISSTLFYRLLTTQKFINGKIKKIPDFLKLSVSSRKNARIQWNLSNSASITRHWARRLRGAWLHKIFISLQHSGIKIKLTDFDSSTSILKFKQKFDQLSEQKKEKMLLELAQQLQQQLKDRKLLFPSEEMQQKLEKLLYTKLEKYEKKLSPWQLLEIGKKTQDPDLQTRVREINYILHGDPRLKPKPQWKEKHREYLELKAQTKKWMQYLKKMVLSEKIQQKVLTLSRKEKLLLSGNYFFETSHLAETTTGFTHAGMVLFLNKKKQPWLFDRVLGFYYANPLKTMKHSAIVELVKPAPTIVNKEKRYALLPYRVKSVFKFKRGSSNRVSWKNIYTDFKKELTPAYKLGAGIIWGIMNLLPNFKKNSPLLYPLYETKKLGKYSYLDFKSLQSLKNKTIYLVARCR
ncbi:MAG: hypothetical protein PF689_09550 [Deltaproteobacteria bacterium]|jgi:hypothetical protein|nr:hypothetical protein [Deltaproteobacteria bacterium]